MKLLIDGDGLIYRCGFAVEKNKYLVVGDLDQCFYFDTHKEAKAWEPDEDLPIWSRKEVEPVENALALVKGALEAMPDGEREIWLSPSVGNFRDGIATISKYKGNRDAAKRPTYYREIYDFLIGQCGGSVTVGQEADDELGIRATILGEASCIVSFDKDLDQIPGHHYNWVTKEAYSISPKNGAMNFYCQILSGDRVDNVDGLPGVGPVKARRMLEGCTTGLQCWQVVLKAYETEFGPRGMANALETARLVYVRRKENEIWQPPKADVRVEV